LNNQDFSFLFFILNDFLTKKFSINNEALIPKKNMNSYHWNIG
jgi:hypothetical protein